MKPEATKVSVELAGGKHLSIETGKLAKQADGSAVVRLGENVVLATAVCQSRAPRGHRLLSAHRRLPRIHLRRRTHSRRLHQARRTHERARSSHQPPDRPAGSSDVRRRLPVRDPGHRLRPLRRHRERSRRVSASTPLRLPSPSPIFRSSARSAPCAWGWWKAVSLSIPTYSEMRESLLNIMVVGTSDAIVMIESGAKEVKEETVVDAIEFAPHRNQEDLRRHQRTAREGRQAEAQSNPARIRRGVTSRSGIENRRAFG